MCYIGLLSVLRYLGLEGTQLKLLPPKILELEHLETQDLRHTKLTTLPVFKSINLMSLIVDTIDGRIGGNERITPSMVYVGKYGQSVKAAEDA
jgi:hypothetical protein